MGERNKLGAGRPLPCRGGSGSRAPRGFTLFEILLVILLIGVLAVFVWPDFRHAQRTENLDESARRIKSLIAMCRAQAMNEGRLYRITFTLDGRVLTARQRDPLKAPDKFDRVQSDWGDLAFVLDGVWVEQLQPLPGGPPPIEVTDELVEFTDEDSELQPLSGFETPVRLIFQPDGSSSSLRWVLRDVLGRGRQMTLDGRLGRVDLIEADSLPADEAQPPKPLPDPDVYENDKEASA